MLQFKAQTNALWQQTSGLEGGYVYHLGRNASTVFAGTDNGIWSSFDEGQSWQILNPAFNDHRIVALTLYNAEILALAIKFGPSNSDDPFLFRSTDAGQTWTQQAIYENPPYVYVGTSGNNSSIWREGSILWIKSSNNLYKSEDDGLTG